MTVPDARVVDAAVPSREVGMSGGRAGGAPPVVVVGASSRLHMSSDPRRVTREDEKIGPDIRIPLSRSRGDGSGGALGVFRAAAETSGPGILYSRRERWTARAGEDLSAAAADRMVLRLRASGCESFFLK